MDSRVTKERFQIHLQYDWLKYILVVIASILIWVTIFSWVNNPSNKEKLEVICYFTPSPTSAMRDTLQSDIKEAFGQKSGIRKFELVGLSDGKNSIIDSHLATTDACIMPREAADYEYFIRDNYFFRMEDISKAGYWANAEGRAMFAQLDAWGALYRYHLSPLALKGLSEEQQAVIKEKAAPYEGKAMGVLLNKIPSGENGCFFIYKELTTDASGEVVAAYKEEYVLLFNKLNLNKKSGGDNKGSFNATNSDASHAEVFDWISYLFAPNDDYTNGMNIGRYCAA